MQLVSFFTLFLLKQRQAAQCVGRVIRSKADYGMMIFADKRLVLTSFSSISTGAHFQKMGGAFTLKFGNCLNVIESLKVYEFLLKQQCSLHSFVTLRCVVSWDFGGKGKEELILYFFIL